MANKTTVYVGGLEEGVSEAVLRAAFLPFGEIKDASMPVDHGTGKNRGFAFVTFQEGDDAAAAIDNMNHAELYGRVLRCNYAQPAKGPAGRAVWAEAGADTYMERLDEEAAKEAADG